MDMIKKKVQKKFVTKAMYTNKLTYQHKIDFTVQVTENDPSAGSPTETLLRLLLPLNNLVCKF